MRGLIVALALLAAQQAAPICTDGTWTGALDQLAARAAEQARALAERDGRPSPSGVVVSGSGLVIRCR